MLPSKLRKLVTNRRWRRADQLTGKVVCQIGGQCIGGLIAAAAVFLNRFENQPVQFAGDIPGQLLRQFIATERDFGQLFAAERAQLTAGARGIVVADGAENGAIPLLQRPAEVQRNLSSDKLVEQN